MKNQVSTIAELELLLNSKLEINRPNQKTQKEIKVLQNKIASLKELELSANAEISENKEIENVVNTEMLDALSALGITEKTKKASNTRSVFKAEYNNKSDRTKCRTKFLSAIELYLLHTAQNKKDLAEKELKNAVEIANKYYSAESAFANYSQYCTENIEDKKKNVIKFFIQTYNANKPNEVEA